MPRRSILRPHCLASDRLISWVPVNSRSPRDASGRLVITAQADLQRILDVMSASWAKGTRSLYGSGLLAYHVFCDSRAITEAQRCPASSTLILLFIANAAGSYSGKTIANYVFAIRAWHILHGQPWQPNPLELKAALDGSTALTPSSSQRPKRQPLTILFLTTAATSLDLTAPFDVAFFACLTVAFYSISRLGELTVPSLQAFDPEQHPKRFNLSTRSDRNGIIVHVLRLPVTKTARQGEDIYWSAQPGASNPEAAMARHLQLNNPLPSRHIFTWNHPKGPRPLTRTAFLNRLKGLASAQGSQTLHGHSIRIGGTLELLLRGVPFDVVKTIGRWSSEAFVTYLRQHAVVMAPYMQGSPILQPFLRYAMPPPR